MAGKKYTRSSQPRKINKATLFDTRIGEWEHIHLRKLTILSFLETHLPVSPHTAKGKVVKTQTIRILSVGYFA